MSDDSTGTESVPEPSGISLPAPEARGPAPTPTPAPSSAEPSKTEAPDRDTRPKPPAGEGSSEGSGEGGPPRPRRRGSRGGRNRRRPSGTGGGTGSGTGGGGAGTGAGEPRAVGGADVAPGGPRPRDEIADDGRARAHNERAAADRGFTADDVGAEAREEAGLSTPAASEVVRPKIGDSRPAPVMPGSENESRSGSGARPNSDRASGERSGGERGESGGGPGSPASGKKRRRRGGRNRSRSGSGGGTGSGGGSGGRPQGGGAVVTSGIPDDGGTVLEDLDEETLERRRGRTRKGRPTGRYQMIVHVGDDRTVQMGVLEGR